MIGERLEGMSGRALTDCCKLAVKILFASREMTLIFFSENRNL